MRITFLGTGAAEGYPALFCNCTFCQRARELGGRNLRARSSALVNDDLLIDYGPDTSAQCIRFNVDLTKIKNILITHSHPDHLSMRDIEHRKSASHYYGKLEMVTLFGNQTTIDVLNDQVRDILKQEFGQRKIAIQPTDEELVEEMEDFLLVKTVVIEPHQTINLEHYKVHAIHAHHNEPELSMNFIIDDGSIRFLYGTDTGTWAESEWEYIESLDIKLDVVALDCTVGTRPSSGHHSNETFLATKNELEERGLLSDDAMFYAHHFSHQWNLVYDDITAIMGPNHVEITFDGLVIEK